MNRCSSTNAALWALLVALLLPAAAAQAGPEPFLVRDIRAGAAGQPFNFLESRGRLFVFGRELAVAARGTLVFRALHSQSGFELWTSDGTAAGTKLLADIVPGTGSSLPKELTATENAIFFTADDGVHGREVWTADAGGVRLVRDIWPGLPSSFPFDLTNVGGVLMFAAFQPAVGFEPHRSDGTREGTQPIDVVPGPGSPLGCDERWRTNFTNVDGTLFFIGKIPGTLAGGFLKSDGTVGGTVPVPFIAGPPFGPFADGFPSHLTNVAGRLFFWASAGDAGRALWKFGATDPAPSIVEVFSSKGSFEDPQLREVDGTLFFRNNDTQAPPNEVFELFKSEPPYDDAVLVKDINPGTPGGRREDAWSFPNDLTNVNGTLFFSANDGTHGHELWKCEPPYNAASTSLVADINPEAAGSFPAYLANVDGTLYFSAVDDKGRELWKCEPPYDAASTVRVADIHRTGSANVSNIINVDGTIFFAADDGGFGNELWAFHASSAAQIEKILEAAVNGLDLDTGISDSLCAKLDGAVAALQSDTPNSERAAAGKLNSFINEVNAQRDKSIPEADANALVATAQEILAEIAN